MLWLIFIAGAIVVYFLVKDKKINIAGTSEAEETLKKRYINGEIDDETYLKMKENIKK